ncbi:NAD(FAD)-utilizing dehydrogenases [Lachnospiraceae bacterium KM106-2]|nr:NAD(FAD)-utilizing dehydrogenases [Lachnospiraceae bacterium KM106-2]
MKYDIIVVGGGASGLVAAINCARNHQKVMILENKDKPGKKILATGNGKCNYTNTYQESHCYRSTHPEFVDCAMSQFGQEDTVAFFKELGILPKSKNGYLYPNSEQAASILDVLLMELAHYDIPIVCSNHVKEIRKTKKGFLLYTDDKTYESNRVILATGGKAASKLGSDGSGYDLAKSLGHRMIPIVPSLVALKAEGLNFKQVSGVRCQTNLTLYVDGEKIYEEPGELQLTNYGISGIPVFQLSRFAGYGIREKKKVTVCIDFMPEFANEELFDYFMKRITQNEFKTMEQLMIGLLNQKLAVELLYQAGIKKSQMANSITKRQIHSLVMAIKECQVVITEPNAFDNAQVCAGGIDVADVSPETMESRIVKGLYLAGELLDVDGICGGYNLQWAWTSGYIAGRSASMK